MTLLVECRNENRLGYRQWFDHYQAHGRNAAWAWLHKLRLAMVRPGRERLAGSVEVDETYLGGLEEGKRGQQTEKRALIVVAAQEDGRSIGRVRMRRIPDASAASLMPFA